MKSEQSTNEQIVAFLQEAQKAEKPILALRKDKGILEATFYTWGRMLFHGLVALRRAETSNNGFTRAGPPQDLRSVGRARWSGRPRPRRP
jgi:hypothetical protein